MYSLVYISTCGSTNDEILKYLYHSPKNDFITIYTFNQTSGRGQYGNVWEAPSNQNLAFSIAVLLDKISISHVLFSFHTANVLRDFIANLTGVEVLVKWPNDIIIKGKKIAGILLEKKKIAGKLYMVIGIGINILQKDFSCLPKAGSIYTQTQGIYDLESWACEMNRYFIAHLLRFSSEKDILSRYMNFLFSIESISVFEIGGVQQNGRIKKVDNEGRLWIDLEHDGLQSFYHKEIELLY